MVTENLNLPAIRLKAELSETSTPEQAIQAVDIVCEALVKHETTTEQLRIILGRMMAEIQDRRLYEPMFSSFEEYTQSVVDKHRLSRTTVRVSLMIARQLPYLSLEDAEAMPMVSLTLVARAAKHSTKAVVNRLIRDAKKLNIIDFREKVIQKGLVRTKTAYTSGEVVIKLRVPKAVARRWESLVGDEDPATVFAALLPQIARKPRKAA